MTFVSVPFPRKSMGGDPGPIRMRNRVLAPIFEMTVSGDLSRFTVLGHIWAQSPGYLPGEIVVDGLLVGGAGHGGTNTDLAKGVYGGLPGQVRRFTALLSELWHTDDDHLVVDIGAGGGGSTTVFYHFYEESDYSNAITAAGGNGFNNDADYYLASLLIARAQAGYRGPDLSSLSDRLGVVSSGFSLMFGNPDGPGAGGAIFDDEGAPVMLPGAPGQAEKGELTVGGGYLNGMSGDDAVAGVFESFGGGGAPGIVDATNNPNGDAGNGGRPGGGGGPTNSPTGIAGQGAQGVLRLRFSVWEKAT